MTTDRGNGKESRDGNPSSSKRPYNLKTQGGTDKKKRPRVGDLRQNSPMSSGGRERNPYSGNTSDRPQRPAYGSEDTSRPSPGSGFSDRPQRPSFSREGNAGNNNRGGEQRSYNSRGNTGGGYNNSSDNQRPSYTSGGDRPQRSSYGSGGNDRGGEQRSYNSRGNTSGGYNNSSDRPQRPSFNREGNDRGTQRPYNNNRSNSGGYNQRDNSPNPRQYASGGTGGTKLLSKPVKYKENIDPSTPLRLNKYLANAGVCSRREADAFITAGVVKVNGVVVNELGSKVTRGDLVAFHDQPVRLESKVYVLLNKPKNCVTTSDDPQNRKTVMDLVRGACPERIYPVGRLDRNTTGVLLLTNDGDLASKLMHPKFKKKKTYQVTLDRDVTMEDMQAMADGVMLEDGEIHADSIAYEAEDILNIVGIEIHSGRNRVVRRMFEKLGYQVEKLDRVFFAGLTKKNVLRGKWRYLSEKEVNMLRMGAFE